MEKSASKFNGSAWGLLGMSLLAELISILTFGIATPWAVCMMYNWYIKYTVIDGKQLYFTGRGEELFGRYIIWFLLSIITLGIYSFRAAIKLGNWLTERTHFVRGGEESSDPNRIKFGIDKKDYEAFIKEGADSNSDGYKPPFEGDIVKFS